MIIPKVVNYIFTFCLFPALAAITAGSLEHPLLEAYQGRLSYNPSKCAKDPQGMVYFTVGNRVLRQPMDNLTYITGGNAQWRAKLNPPPVPSEPEGCPDHPIQGVAYDLRRLSAMPKEAQNDTSKYADQVSVVISEGPFAHTEDSLFDKLQKDRGTDEDASGSFIRTKTPADEAYYVAYKAEQYFDPSGKKLTMACYGDVHQGIAGCHYGYHVSENMNVWWGFATAVVPIEQWINADRELRRRLVSAEVSDHLKSESQVNK